MIGENNQFVDHKHLFEVGKMKRWIFTFYLLIYLFKKKLGITTSFEGGKENIVRITFFRKGKGKQ